MPHIKPVDILFSIMRREVRHPDGSVTVTVTPPAFVKSPGKSVTLTREQYVRYQRWQEGALIQDVLYDLSPVQREILINGDPDLGDSDA